MTPQKRLRGLLVVLLVGVATLSAQLGSAQDGTPVATPLATPGAASCTGIGEMPALQIVLTIDERPGQTISGETVDRTAAVLARRAASVAPEGCEVLVQPDGSIRVSLAVTPALDAETAVSTLAESARLEIVETGGTVPELGGLIDPEGALLTELGLATPAATPGTEPYPAILTGSDIVDADAVTDASGLHQVAVTLTEDATARFARYTAGHVGDPLAIVLDGRVISVPVIQSEISGGQVLIEGGFTESEAETLATQLRAGSLPATLTVVSVHRVTPDGQEEVPIGEVDGVETFTIETAQHTTDPVAYPQSPPVGGMHDPRWQNCGFYDTPVRNENAVHSLEHGVVWITYHPDLPTVEVDALRQLTLVNDRLLVSPYPGLVAPIVLSTWDRQLRLESVDDPRLFAFIDAYTGQAPEPGANCQGGVGTPG